MECTESFAEELLSVPRIADTAIALARYAESISGGKLVREGKQWVVHPRRSSTTGGFVTFLVQPRVRNLRLTLRGRTHEFAKIDDLTLSDARANSWSKCVIKSRSQ